jgi:hypothetical protein
VLYISRLESLAQRLPPEWRDMVRCVSMRWYSAGLELQRREVSLGREIQPFPNLERILVRGPPCFLTDLNLGTMGLTVPVTGARQELRFVPVKT